MRLKRPIKQGLYDPRFEHDACGVGLIVDIKGRKSHKIIEQSLVMLNNLSHRGACGCEPNTGDGAGILFQIPHDFLKKAAQPEGINLPEVGQYGVGMIFLPQNDKERTACEKAFEKIIQEEGQSFLCWRCVPTCHDPLGKTAKLSEPVIKQIFIGRAGDLEDALAFERKLYVIRRRIENAVRETKITDSESFYVCSLSSRTLVYKGMLLSEQISTYFPDLSDTDLTSCLALVHSRFSTNTFPSWSRAHPYRYIIHNGEINTLRGNINWMHARQAVFASKLFGEDITKILPVIDPDGSDSGMFDNCLEFLMLAGRPMHHVAMMMIPEPWEKHENMSDEKKAFYEYHSSLMEPWDGPSSIAFTDGATVGAVLDRNGLRPSRYYVTKDDLVIMASEVGVLDVPQEDILYKGRLQPGRMFLVDTQEGRIIEDEEIKTQLTEAKPYRDWLDDNLIKLDDLPGTGQPCSINDEDLRQQQRAFGYTFEELRKIIIPMATHSVDPIGAMGSDTPLSVLSDMPKLLYTYFKQLFAQVTNPPIDGIREEIITSALTTIGPGKNLLEATPENCRQIRLETPILTNAQLAKLKHMDHPHFKSAVLPIFFDPTQGGAGLEKAMDALFAGADAAIEDNANILILSDRGITAQKAPIPALLAVSGLHHHLIRNGTRTQVSLVLESGEPREVHHFAVLIGYGASGINPYLAFSTIKGMIQNNMLTGLDEETALKHYRKATLKGVLKVISKMGISTMQSYCGAQIFEAIGLHHEVIDKYFTWTPSRIEGANLHAIAMETGMRHAQGFASGMNNAPLEEGGEHQWRYEGERHLFNPQSIHSLQLAARTNDYDEYRRYAEMINNQSAKLSTLRGLFEFKFENKSLPLEEVESVASICKRFKTGAMSYGSISQEAHECMAIAMNRINGKSNTGEGGEDPARYVPDVNGDSRSSAIKQVASGRFGVTSDYLVNAKEIQIKMAQGAKPGEGGQLPGNKVYPWVAKVRMSTPGVGLISPPPHHDIYSIEDLAELIHDLKNANRNAKINVKLVSEVGVGTIAVGVAKGHADVVLISGYDGGTGAAPRTAIKHTGMPWELGVAETHQTLVLNDLRSRIVVEADGQLKTGRDVAIAALLGAEEFGFATAPLIVMGCVMMRVCNLDTCPVGIATQNPDLRKKFQGHPAHVVNYLHFVAQELREIMAKLGFRTLNEMIGHTDRIAARKALDHWKAKGLDYTNILHQPDMPASVGRYCRIEQDHGIEKSLDAQKLLEICKPAIEKGEKVEARLPINNVNRVVGTITGSEITRAHGSNGLPEDTIKLRFNGSAGQSFGAFVPRGMTLVLEGDANDYIGKGLSGGKIIVMPPEASTFVPEENIIIGNVAFYGATSGEAYICGMAGERFCVRNSGMHAVVEAVGDHGCEYMTGGKVVVLGATGRNFAAGMSGGIVYVLDEQGDFHKQCNQDMVLLEHLEEAEEIHDLRIMIEQHANYTRSDLARRVLDNWQDCVGKFIKVYPKDYKRMIEAVHQMTAKGLSHDEAVMAAFEENKKNEARISGN